MPPAPTPPPEVSVDPNASVKAVAEDRPAVAHTSVSTSRASAEMPLVTARPRSLVNVPVKPSMSADAAAPPTAAASLSASPRSGSRPRSPSSLMGWLNRPTPPVSSIAFRTRSEAAALEDSAPAAIDSGISTPYFFASSLARSRLACCSASSSLAISFWAATAASPCENSPS